MPRSPARVQRFIGPLGGLVTHVDAHAVPITSAQDCENVVLMERSIRARNGLRRLESATIADCRIEGLWGGLTAPASGAAAEIIVIKTSAMSGDYVNGALYFSFAVSGAYQAQAGTAITINGNVPTFVQHGQRDANAESQVYMLDGSARAHRIPLSTGKAAYPVGLTAPTISASTFITSGLTHPTFGDNEYRVTLVNRANRPADDESGRPGLESSASPIKTQNVSAASEAQLTVSTVDPAIEPWTHIRVYRKGPSQAHHLFIGEWARPINPSGLQESGDGLLLWLSDTSYKLDEAGPFEDGPAGGEFLAQPNGNDPWDFAPTRNGVPANMRYLAFWGARSFWGRPNEPGVFYSDVFDSQSGGHFEAISGEKLPILDAPTTLLAVMGEGLIIGTTIGLHAILGTLVSHDNNSAAQGLKLPVISPTIRRFPGATPPVAQGTGSYVIAAGNLYYISAYGLERFNGQISENVSDGIEGLLGTSNNLSVLQTATLAHDSIERRIYMLVRTPVSGGKYTEDIAGTTGQLESVIYVYHYARPNPETGRGDWTKIERVGVCSESSAHDQRYSAIGVRQTGAARPLLMVGMRIYDATDTRFDDAQVYTESLTEARDEKAIETSPTNVTVPWSWKSGSWDFGYPDIQKQVHHVVAKTKAITGGTAENYTVAAHLDADPTPTQDDFAETLDRADLSVGAFVDSIAVELSGDSGANGTPSETLGFTVEAEAADAY